MQTLWQDLRYGARLLRKNPGFSLIALLSLTLGIGATTAIFSLVNTVLLRPLPVEQPHQLQALNVQSKGGSMAAFSYPNYVDFRDRNEVLAGIYASRITPMGLSHNGNNERIWGYEVSGNYFQVLGVQAVKGRMFTSEEDRVPLANPLAVLSYGCWQRRFASDPDIIGNKVIINGHSFQIIGVAPPGFVGTELIFLPEVWVPMTMQEWIEPGNAWLERRSTQNIFVTGRLKPEVSREQAEASLNLLSQQLGQEYPNENEGLSIVLTQPGFVLPNIRDAFVSFSTILLATVALVLLIACTNIASLMLARATKRRKEIAIRLSLGASRAQLIHQLLTESLLLSLLGGAAGLLLAIWIIELVVAFKPPVDFPITIDLQMDWRVLLFSLLLSLGTSLLFGFIPALQATKSQVVSALKDETTIGGYRRSKLRSSLVVLQIALSLVLLIAAGLALRSLQHLQTMNPGFATENGLIMSFDLGLQGYDQVKGKRFEQQIIERVRALPGVRSAALTDLLPLSGNYSGNTVYVEGQPPVRGAEVPSAMVSSVSADYFSTMEIALLAGRSFTEQDNDKASQVAIVNESFVRRLIPELGSVQEAIGKRFSFQGVAGPFIQIVGVTGDGKYWTIGEAPQPFAYSPLLQSYNASVSLVVRTSVEPRSLISAIRQEFQTLDETLPVFSVKTLTEHMGFSLFPARVAALLLGSFGLLALLLAAIGIYGVMAYSVAQRTREIGIRMALGAQAGEVLKMVLKQGVTLALLGVSLGLLAALAVTQLMSSVLYGVSATDLLTFVLVSALLTGVAMVACLVPARRAAKVDPMIALRYE
ncbi:MAG: ABC transporter permease [Acidobacteria bacterium]|nr:ABC transporter permease [Acidobacteriota bacterium]